MVEREATYDGASLREPRVLLPQGVTLSYRREQTRTPGNPIPRSLSFENQDLNPFGDSDGYYRRISNESDRSGSPVPLHSLPSATAYGPQAQERNHPQSPSKGRFDDNMHALPLQRFQEECFDRLRKAVNHPWLLEILSSFIAALALLATIVTLADHERKPLPQWPHLISINALIAIFTTIFKASLLMPVAEGVNFSYVYGRDEM
ncbi:MAG: hypothetical protein Q9194_003752 [Teloschistes cf. exilis]